MIDIENDVRNLLYLFFPYENNGVYKQFYRILFDQWNFLLIPYAGY